MKILNVGLHVWISVFVALTLTLFYGFVIGDLVNGGLANSNSANNTSTIEVDNITNMLRNTEQLSLPLTLHESDNEHLNNQSNAAKQSNSTEVRREAVLMGSQFIFIVDAPKQQALLAITEAAAAIKALEMNLSSWKPSSDISRLNERAGRHPVKVASETLSLLQMAKDLSKKTNNAFDVTVGAVWDLWPFRNPNQPLPSTQDIDQHLRLVNTSAIVLNEQESTAYLPIKGMKVNLGAIGKGYAAELAINKMRSLGIERAAVSAGGDLYLLGEKKSGPWVVELEHPRWPGRYIDRFVAGDIAVATSGDAKQYVEKNGKRYSHIIDPRNGWPANDCQSVTVVTKSSTQADAYATAVYVMGAKQGLIWVDAQPEIEALIVDADGRVHRSSGWQDLTQQSLTQQSAKAI